MEYTNEQERIAIVAESNNISQAEAEIKVNSNRKLFLGETNSKQIEY